MENILMCSECGALPENRLLPHSKVIIDLLGVCDACFLKKKGHVPYRWFGCCVCYYEFVTKSIYYPGVGDKNFRIWGFRQLAKHKQM